jgi:asparagine synthase (glutamine-hydrolysing)
MCGIFGYIGNRLNIDKLEGCVDRLKHRGPDGRGSWYENGVFLGHRRLSILDLSKYGKQPMHFMDNRYTITFNGEIYNFIELRDTLIQKGYRFKTDSDTEVLLASYHEWGEECQYLFNGMWAFAIWDAQERKLFISRDRFGVKPLYYRKCDDDSFVFASEMKAIFPFIENLKPNYQLVRDLKRIFKYESTEECVVEGILRFPAGHCAIYENNVLKIKRWWCTLDHLLDVPESYEKQVAQFQELFYDSCRLRMRSDVPIGTALSGGVDSSAVICAVAKNARENNFKRISEDWQHAFIAGFPGTPLDETDYAVKVTKSLGIKETIINIDPTKYLGKMNEYAYLFEDLYITSPIPFMATYKSIRDNGVIVSLDGHGADELFGGYPFDYIRVLKDLIFNIPTAMEITNTYFGSIETRTGQFNRIDKTKFLTGTQIKNIIKKMLGKDTIISKEMMHNNWERLDTLNKLLYVSTHETTLPTLLRNYDRYSMANGVEIRMPFMDYRMVCFAFSIPWTSKIRNGFSKSIVRDALSSIVPHEVIYRKSKIGFNSPVVDWMKGPLKEYFLDNINSSNFKNCDIIDSVDVAEKIKKVIFSENPGFLEGEEAWTLFYPFIWKEALFR